MDFKKELESYKQQLEKIKDLFMKIQGKIELCEQVLKEKKDKK